MTDIKAFNRWSTEGIKVNDPGLRDYICLDSRFIPRTGGRNIGNKFHKAKIFIVERLMNKLMVTGHRSKKHKLTSYKQTGKSHTVYDIIEKTLGLVEERTKKNPIEVFVIALENSAPYEEIISIEYGGARYPKAVECSPQRRVDFALRLMTQGAYQKSFNSKRSIAECLADEIIYAYNRDTKSMALSKRYEIERQADSSR